ncbi:hypothetical protein SDC9_142376 [bioreactor metagenome]|uniref:Uncharacterized protein n=1 Tax=bioreactor metagenome TaxID=1076179 RepID=A0A645E336_9ZZZZ
MVTDIIQVIIFFRSVLDTPEYTADIGLSHGTRPEGCGIRQHSLQKLKRNDLMALKFDWLNGCHSDILQAFEMSKITLSERHKKTYSFNSLQI